MNAHAATLQAAGLDAGAAIGLAEGELSAEAVGPDAIAMEPLAKKSVRAPAALEPRDLQPLLDRFGVAGTMELVIMLASFHFINRIADLVDVQSELPIVQRRWRWLRGAGVRLQGRMMRRLIDLENRPADVDAAALLADLATIRGEVLAPGYDALRHAPSAIASLHATTRPLPTMDAETTRRVTETVGTALPANESESTGFHARPTDPLDALAFVGTRYVVRVTDEMVDAVRTRYGWSDAELTDLFFLISYRNAAERLDRLLAAPLP